MRRRRHLLVLPVLATALLLPACSGGTNGSTPAPASSDVQPTASSSPTAVIATEAALASLAPAGEGCAAMDGIVADALRDSEPGRAFTQAVGSLEGSTVRWLALVDYLATSERGRLAAAAGQDPVAADALSALDTYARLAPQVLGGQMEQYADPIQAKADLEAGREPSPDPAFLQAEEDMAEAHAALSECMPSWPVVF